MCDFSNSVSADVSALLRDLADSAESFPSVNLDHLTVLYLAKFGQHPDLETNQLDLDPKMFQITSDSIVMLKNAGSKEEDPMPIREQQNLSEILYRFETKTPGQDVTLDLVVQEVANPHNFWVILRENVKVLEDFMLELNMFYDKHQAEYKVTGCLVHYEYYAMPYEDQGWHRAQYVRNGFFFIDYGTFIHEEKVDLKQVRNLNRKFTSLPAQAYHASINSVEPLSSSNWTEEATNRFLKEIRNCMNYNGFDVGGAVGKVCGIHKKAGLPGVVSLDLMLVDTFTNDCPGGRSLEQVLVKEGHAIDVDKGHEKTDVNKSLLSQQIQLSQQLRRMAKRKMWKKEIAPIYKDYATTLQ